MKLFSTLALGSVLGQGVKKEKKNLFWINNYDADVEIECIGAPDNFEKLTWRKISYTTDRGTDTVEIAELERDSEGNMKEPLSFFDSEYSIDDKGTLTILKDSFGVKDIYELECDFSKNSISDSYKVKTQVNYVEEKDLEPTVRSQKLGEDGKMHYNIGDTFSIAECDSKPAGPAETPLEWLVYKEDVLIHSTSDFDECDEFCGKVIDRKVNSDNPTTTLTMPLAFTKAGITPEYDDVSFKCEAAYKVARNGKLETVKEKTQWPADGNTIRVIHPVTNVNILVGGKIANAGIIDNTYTDNSSKFGCSSNGFDPSSENVINHHDTIIVDGKYTCEAKNELNEDWVRETKSFTEAKFAEIQYESKGLWITLSQKEKNIPESSVFTPVVFNCKTFSNIKEDGKSKELYKEELYKDLENKVKTKECEQAKEKTDGSGVYYIDADFDKLYYGGKLVVEDLSGSQTILYRANTASNQRSFKEVDNNDLGLPVEGTWDKLGSDFPNKEVTIYSYDPETKKVTEVTDGIVSNPESNRKVHSKLEDPEDGHYIVCYDFNDDREPEKHQGSWEDVKVKISSKAQDYCNFHTVESFPWWWLLIVILVIIILVLLIFFCWKRRTPDDDDEESVKEIPGENNDIGPDAGPTVFAMERTDERSRHLSDARDDFQQGSDEPNEATPLNTT